MRLGSLRWRQMFFRVFRMSHHDILGSLKSAKHVEFRMNQQSPSLNKLIQYHEEAQYSIPKIERFLPGLDANII